MCRRFIQSCMACILSHRFHRYYKETKTVVKCTVILALYIFNKSLTLLRGIFMENKIYRRPFLSFDCLFLRQAGFCFLISYVVYRLSAIASISCWVCVLISLIYLIVAAPNHYFFFHFIIAQTLCYNASVSLPGLPVC